MSVRLKISKAARELGKMREEICEAIEQIPETISNTQALASLYQGQTLHLHALRLYVAIMDILQLSINWYEEKPLRKVGLAIFKGSDYPRQLSLKLQELRSLESRIDKQSFIHQQMDQARSMFFPFHIPKRHPLINRRLRGDCRDSQRGEITFDG